MAIPDEFLYEYAVVRYVPRVDREEFVNIGLVMMCKRRRWLRGDIRLNETRIKALAPGADIKFLANQASIFMRDDVPSAESPVEERYRWLVAVKSAVLQVSPSHPGILAFKEAKSPQEAVRLLNTEFDRLFKDLVL